jgi:hypothetical protein
VPDNACPWIYYSLAIHVNGDVVPCCRDPKGEEVMGNRSEQKNYQCNESHDWIPNAGKGAACCAPTIKFICIKVVS